MTPKRQIGNRFFRRLLTTMLTACVISSFTRGETESAPPVPPRPNPAKPANYLEWIHSSCATGSGNAEKDYRKAFEKISPFEGDWDEALSLAGANRPAVSQWLSANEKGLRLFREAAMKPSYCSRLDTPRPTGDPRVDGLFILLESPSLRPYRTASRGLIAEGYREWKRGDPSRLTQNALAVLRSSNHLFTGSTLLERMVATANRATAYDSIFRSLRLAKDPGTLAATLVSQLADSDQPIPPFTPSVERERLAILDFCQRVFIPGEDEKSWQVHKPVLDVLRAPGKRKMPSARIARIGYRRTIDEVNAYFDAVVDWGEKPYHVVAARRDGGGNETDALGQMGKGSRNPLMKVLLPSLAMARELNERITATQRATRLVVHLFHHHQQHKEFPPTLEDLDVPNLAELRLDPFSGTDFVYQPRRGSFTLYSIASNLIDDGGKANNDWKSGDYVFWPVRE